MKTKINLITLLVIGLSACKLGYDVSPKFTPSFNSFSYKRILPGKFEVRENGQSFSPVNTIVKLPEVNFVNRFDGVCGSFVLDSNMYEKFPRNTVDGVQQTSKLSGFSNYLNPFHGTPHRIYSNRLGYQHDLSKPFHIVLGIYTDIAQQGYFKAVDTVRCGQRFNFYLSATDSVRLYIKKTIFVDTLIAGKKVQFEKWAAKPKLNYGTQPAVENSVIYELFGFYGGSNKSNRYQSYTIYPIVD